ncbi:putative PEP-CTERM system histidine kinase [Novosphingobium kunmingense]|uniref:histidine kinase n=1 Tax=Novosphingobium kunmingense TaxID=1211806 RepID=A0A2N0I1U9_9SPHN|nr:XrtA/PEP-CTERM system histidine kinase PrsK [Novosphingobium kunmingense]PKB25166.1 putative PEP-CTERM system histidine kinase [Novosphingobium kunmingense]
MSAAFGSDGLWPNVATLAWEAGALACVIAGGWLLAMPRRYGPASRPLGIALALTAVWALSGAFNGLHDPATTMLDCVRNLAWLFALYRLFSIDGRHTSMAPIRPILLAVAFVEVLKIGGVMALLRTAPGAVEPVGFHTFVSLGLLVSIGGLVLAHNLYGGASAQARLLLRWPALALALLWGFDLTYYVIAYLSGSSPVVLDGLRGAMGLVFAGLVVLGARDDSVQIRFRPSHAATFQSLSLLLIGGYLVVLVAIAQWLAFSGTDFSAQMQIGFVAVVMLAGLAVLPSRRLRGWLRVSLTKHLFAHRFDYRAEWLRFTRTIGQAGGDAASLEERAIRALADITESPAGLLLTRGEDGLFELAARWQWPTADVPSVALDAETVGAFEQTAFVADIDALRNGGSMPERCPPLPDWLMAEPRAWSAVPLLHFDRLVGLVVLARPAYTRALDWEDFDLLRVAGRQLASYLAESKGQEALAEASRFDDFHRRIAFVMHDIKNLASQLSLLARNAELHSENPDFRADMLLTLRNSADKLNALLARLSRYGSMSVQSLAPVRVDEIAARVVQQFAGIHPVLLIESEGCEVSGEPESLEQVILHLVQNAVDASAADSEVMLRVTCDNLNGGIEIVDSGYGMSAEFIRNRLFKPFDSTKSGGFGIGAYEARELVRAMGGRLEVESREGLGSRFAIHLPLASSAALRKSLEHAGKKVA